MYLAYTSFAVRMLQGRDILKSTAAALDAQAFLQLCRAVRRRRRADRPVAGARGQSGRRWRPSAWRSSSRASPSSSRSRRGISRRPRPTRRPRPSPGRSGRPAPAWRCCTDAATRASRRAAAWDAFTSEMARDARCACGRSSSGIVSRSASRTTRTGSRRSWSRCCGASTARTSAPASTSATTSRCSRIPTRRSRCWRRYAVTTHLKDMAVRPTESGFELSEVPLGQGMLPLERYVATLRQARPAAPLCLEMITRDPLPVPYKTERYWVAFDAPDRRGTCAALRGSACSARRRTGRCRARPGLTADAQVAAEDEHVAALGRVRGPRAEAHGGLNGHACPRDGSVSPGRPHGARHRRRPRPRPRDGRGARRSGRLRVHHQPLARRRAGGRRRDRGRDGRQGRVGIEAEVTARRQREPPASNDVARAVRRGRHPGQQRRRQHPRERRRAVRGGLGRRRSTRT